MIRSAYLFVVLGVLSLLTGRASAQTWGNWEPIAADYTNVRGVNYIPDYLTPIGQPSYYVGVASPHAQWEFYDQNMQGVGGEVDTQLMRLKGMGVNSVRVWLSFLAYWDTPPGPNNTFIKNLGHFFSLCDKYRIRCMPVVWDSHGGDPDLTDPLGRQPPHTNVVAWKANPGIASVTVLSNPATFLSLAEPYLRDITNVSKAYPNVVFCWDIFNEPPIADATHGLAHDLVTRFTATTLKVYDPTKHTTVSMAGWLPDFQRIRDLAKVNEIDVLSGHPYCHFREGYEAHVRFAAMCLTPQANWNDPVLSKPFLATELGGPGPGAHYAEAINYARNVVLPNPGTQQGIGFMLWQAIVGYRDLQALYDSHHAYKNETGIFYIDGPNVHVREIAAYTAFHAESQNQGATHLTIPGTIIERQPTHNSFVPQFPMPLGTKYQDWLNYLNPLAVYSSPSYLDPNGPRGIGAQAELAGHIFAWVTLYSFIIHDQGPVGYRAFELPQALKVTILTKSEQYWDVNPGPPLTPQQHLDVLEEWRQALLICDLSASGPY